MGRCQHHAPPAQARWANCGGHGWAGCLSARACLTILTPRPQRPAPGSAARPAWAKPRWWPPICRPDPRPAPGCNWTPATPTPPPWCTFWGPPPRWRRRPPGCQHRRPRNARRPRPCRPPRPTTCVISRPTCGVCSGTWRPSSICLGRWCSTTCKRWARPRWCMWAWPLCWPSCPSAPGCFSSAVIHRPTPTPVRWPASNWP